MKKLTVAESISQNNKTTIYLDMKLYYMLRSITCHTRDLHLFIFSIQNHQIESNILSWLSKHK